MGEGFARHPGREAAAGREKIKGRGWMLCDAESLTDGSTLETDLCIVGAGPAGIALALECAGAGFDICLIESGERTPKRATQDLASGPSVGHPYYRLRRTRARAFGGTSHYWFDRSGLRVRPLDALDFRTRPGIPYSGWPFGQSELDPYYRRAHRMLDVSPCSYNPANCEDGPGARRLSLPPGDEFQTIVFRYAAKQVFLTRFDDIAKAQNVRLFLGSTVVEICAENNPAVVDRVRVKSMSGRRFAIVARRYVLATGGIGNARMLLASNRTQPAGLGNEHGLLGRFFMERVTVRSGVMRLNLPAPLDLYRERVISVGLVQGMLALKPEVVLKEKILNCAAFVIAQPAILTTTGALSLDTLRRGIISRPAPPELMRHAMHVLRWGASSLFHPIRTGASLRRSDKLFQLKWMVEQAPNPESRVTLSERRDKLGMPRARLDWRVTDLEHRTIRRSQDILDGNLRRANLGRVEGKWGEERASGVIHGQRHHRGTTRMHVSSRFGVVNADGRVHSMRNLYIAGSSVFPTSGYANPTLTVVALAIRLADHLKKAFGNDRAAAGESKDPGGGLPRSVVTAIFGFAVEVFVG